MKALKPFLFIGAMFTALSSLHAQGTPPEKPRGNSTFTQVDDYLNIKKRIGIPAGTLETLNGLPGAPAYLYFRTDSNTLRVYNPETSKWVNAVPGIDQGKFILASPASPQSANIDVEGNLFLNGGYIDKVSTIYVRGDNGLITSNTVGANILNAEAANLQHAIFDVNSLSDGNYLKFFNGIVENDVRKYSQLRTDNLGFEFINEGNNLFTIGYNGKILLPISPASSISDYAILTRDNSTGEVKKIASDGLNYIKASPSGPQEADISLGASNRITVPRLAASHFETYSDDDTNIDFSPKGNLLFNMGTGQTVQLGAGNLEDENGVNVSFMASKITIYKLPQAATDFELLTRDKTTGEIKKIELAELKAMLNAIQ